MYIVFILIAIALSLYSYYCYMNTDEYKMIIAIIAALSMLFTGIIINWNSNQMSKVKLLKKMGMEPLTTEQVYDMSGRQLNNCTGIICTVNKIYYYREGASAKRNK